MVARISLLILSTLVTIFACGRRMTVATLPTPTPTPTRTAVSPVAPSGPATPTHSAAPDPASTQGRIVYTCQKSRDARFNHLCLMNSDGTEPKQLTVSDEHDHLYPSLVPTGRSVVFSSNLAGDYEIYELMIEGGTALRRTSHGGAYAPEVSPDGGSLVYTVLDEEDRSLWLAEREGAAPRWLIGQAWDATWSPDGAWILHASDRGGDIQLWRVRPDGSGLRQVTDLPGLRGRSDWAPSGGMLATYAGSSWEREIYLFDQDGDRVVQLTDGGNNLAPSFSPSGERVAFTSYQNNYLEANGCEIYIATIDTGHQERLTDNDYCDWQPRWGRSP